MSLSGNPNCRSTDQYQPAYWDNFESNTDIIKKYDSSSEFYRIQLLAGYSYKLTGSVAILCSGDARPYRSFGWYNTNKNTFIGAQGGFVGGDDTAYTGSGAGSAIAYIHPEEDTIIELRCSKAVVSSRYQEPGTSFNIENLENLTI